MTKGGEIATRGLNTPPNETLFGLQRWNDYIFIRLANLGGGPQAQVHMEGKKCRQV